MAEEIYQQSLEVELGIRSIQFVAQAELNVYFKGYLINYGRKGELEWKRHLLDDLHRRSS